MSTEWETQTVQTFCLVSHHTGMGDKHSDRPIRNHTSAFLLLDNEQQSVQIDMRTTSTAGEFDVVFDGAHNRRHWIWHVDLRPTELCTPERVREAIMEEHLDEYTFDPTGSGCRYWQLNLVRLLETRQLLMVGSSLVAVPFLVNRYIRTPYNHLQIQPADLLPGTFDRQSTRTIVNERWGDILQDIRERRRELGERLPMLRDRRVQMALQIDESVADRTADAKDHRVLLREDHHVRQLITHTLDEHRARTEQHMSLRLTAADAARLQLMRAEGFDEGLDEGPEEGSEEGSDEEPDEGPDEELDEGLER